jgi:hypothetical protein
MIMLAELVASLDQTVRNVQDSSGKTPLDLTIENLNLSSAEERRLYASVLENLFPQLVEKGVLYLKLGRQLIRRTKLHDRELAVSLMRVLNQQPATDDVDLRLWLSLALMDLGFPRSVADLQRDVDLRTGYPGEWLTLVAANENYLDVRNAFMRAVSDSIISADQLLIKAPVIRRQFGAQFLDFMRSVVRSFGSRDERRKMVEALIPMYGMNISDVMEDIGTPPMSGTWVSPRTMRLLEKVGSDATQRAEATQRVA